MKSRVDLDWAINLHTLHLRVAIPMAAVRHRLQWQTVSKALAAVMRRSLIPVCSWTAWVRCLPVLVCLTQFICVSDLGLGTRREATGRYVAVMLSLLCILLHFTFIFVVADIVDVERRRASVLLFVRGMALLFLWFASRCIQWVWVNLHEWSSRPTNMLPVNCLELLCGAQIARNFLNIVSLNGIRVHSYFFKRGKFARRSRWRLCIFICNEAYSCGCLLVW